MGFTKKPSTQARVNSISFYKLMDLTANPGYRAKTSNNKHINKLLNIRTKI